MGDYIAGTKAANVINELIGMVARQWRDIEPADTIAIENHHRLLFELGCVVDDKLLGEAVSDDRINRFWPRREGLCCSCPIARHLSLHDRTLFDRPNWLACFAVKGKDETLFGILNKRRNALTINREIH